MPRLVITVHNPSRVPLAKFYILIREIIDWFGLDQDVTVELEES